MMNSKRSFPSFLKLHLFSIGTPKGELTLCSHPAESMHKPKVHIKGRDPGAKLVVGMVQSSESQASVRRGLDWDTGQPVLPLLALREACPIAKGLFDALNVVLLPTLPHSLLLMGRMPQPSKQLILSILVNEGQGNGGKATFWPRFKPPLHRNMFLRDQFNEFSRHWHQSAETCHLSLLLTLQEGFPGEVEMQEMQI